MLSTVADADANVVVAELSSARVQMRVRRGAMMAVERMLKMMREGGVKRISADADKRETKWV